MIDEVIHYQMHHHLLIVLPTSFSKCVEDLSERNNMASQTPLLQFLNLSSVNFEFLRYLFFLPMTFLDNGIRKTNPDIVHVYIVNRLNNFFRVFFNCCHTCLKNLCLFSLSQYKLLNFVIN